MRASLFSLFTFAHSDTRIKFDTNIAILSNCSNLNPFLLKLKKVFLRLYIRFPGLILNSKKLKSSDRSFIWKVNLITWVIICWLTWTPRALFEPSQCCRRIHEPIVQGSVNIQHEHIRIFYWCILSNINPHRILLCNWVFLFHSPVFASYLARHGHSSGSSLPRQVAFSSPDFYIEFSWDFVCAFIIVDQS